LLTNEGEIVTKQHSGRQKTAYFGRWPGGAPASRQQERGAALFVRDPCRELCHLFGLQAGAEFVRLKC
ncbi:MAG TPA: hypothetical protein PLJ47_15660, partial [Candidatus Hydrogenedentes bacterium]|nr:hypothetical protein [Candidatus Hydrogenedentota bacterium]